jgi:hypothetical protein
MQWNRIRSVRFSLCARSHVFTSVWRVRHNISMSLWVFCYDPSQFCPVLFLNWWRYMYMYVCMSIYIRLRCIDQEQISDGSDSRLNIPPHSWCSQFSSSFSFIFSFLWHCIVWLVHPLPSNRCKQAMAKEPLLGNNSSVDTLFPQQRENTQ